MATIIDCKAIASSIKEDARHRADYLRHLGCFPTIVVIQVGDDTASNVYIRNKQKACEQCGIKFIHQHFPSSITSVELEQYIQDLNASSGVHAIMVQFPLPDHLKNCPQSISPLKDVDGITSYSQGKLMLGGSFFLPVPCTTRGIENALYSAFGDRFWGGKHAVIIGRSSIVGKPTAMSLLNRDCTVVVCHSHTQNLAEIMITLCHIDSCEE